MLYLRPIVKRSLSSLPQHISEGQCAFFLGAGVDIQLANDAGNSDGRSLQQLISTMWDKVNGIGKQGTIQPVDMAPENCPHKHELKCCKNIHANYITQWPAEMASLIRWWWGDQKFNQKIAQLVNVKDFKPNFKRSFTNNLCELSTQAQIS